MIIAGLWSGGAQALIGANMLKESKEELNNI